MARIIAFANQKGGVGKTMLSVQAAFYYALKKKKSVLFVDMDTQANSTRLLLGTEGVLTDEETKSYQLLEEDLAEITVHETQHKGLDLIGATLQHGKVMDMLLTDQIGVKDILQRLRARLELLTPHYDYIILDCPPAQSVGLVSSLIAADYVVCPLRLSGVAMDGLAQMTQTIVWAKEHGNPDVEFVGLVINDYDMSGNQKNSIREIRKVMGDEVFKAELRHRSPYDMAMTGGTGIPIWNIKNGKAAAEEMKKLFVELDQRIAKFEKGE